MCLTLNWTIAAFAAGLGLAAFIAFRFWAPRARHFAAQSRQFGRSFTRPAVDLNSASIEQLVGLGLERTTAERIVEGRPYRNKLELVSRIIVPTDVYSSLKYRVTASGTRDAVKVAS